MLRVRTQWNVGMGGPTGLRYEALYPLIERSGADFEETLDCIQAMEGEALSLFQERTRKDTPQ